MVPAAAVVGHDIPFILGNRREGAIPPHGQATSAPGFSAGDEVGKIRPQMLGGHPGRWYCFAYAGHEHSFRSDTAKPPCMRWAARCLPWIAGRYVLPGCSTESIASDLSEKESQPDPLSFVGIIHPTSQETTMPVHETRPDHSASANGIFNSCGQDGIIANAVSTAFISVGKKVDVLACRL